MKNSISAIGAIIFALVTFVSVQSFAQTSASSDAGKKVTVTGEVLDMQCYTAEGAHGEKHKTCGEKCIKEGAPIGLLDKDGKVTLLVKDEDKEGDFSKLKDYADENVTVTGTMYNRGGMQSMVVSTVTPSK